MKSKHSVQLTWLGHSAFHVQSASGKSILIDPWLDNPMAPPDAKAITNVDVILLSHGHSDHIGNTVEIARRTNAKVICIYEVGLFLRAAGVSDVVGMNKGGSAAVGEIKITMVHARHSGDIDVDGKVVAAGGGAAGLIVRLENGFTLYHAGDTSLFGDMKFIGKLYSPDLALLPIGDLYTMGPREAALACELIKPKKIIGMHYGTFPALTGTPQLLKKYLHTKMKNRVLELTPGTPVLF